MTEPTKHPYPVLLKGSYPGTCAENPLDDGDERGPSVVASAEVALTLTTLAGDPLTTLSAATLTTLGS